ncbi:MAG TPA: serine/threonine-protein kinase [Verrucomicrobiae bacterium]
MLAKTMQQMRAHWREAVLGAAVAGAAGLLAWLPRFFAAPDQLTGLEKFGYDLGHVLQAERPATEVQIIEMDQRSFRERGQDTAALWDRTKHAGLLQKLTKDGARVVVFDVLFDIATRPEADEQFAASMRAHGKVALAATRAEVSRPGLVGFEPVFPIDVLRDAAAGVGMVNVAKDQDGAVRRPFLEAENHPSLPWVAARLAGAASLPEANRTRARWLNYYGPPAAVLPRISYADAIDQPDGYFRDKSVFIGSTLRIKRPGEDSDFFRTSFTRWSGAEAAGVTLVAMEFLNLIRDDFITRTSAVIELPIILVIGFLSALGCLCFRPLAATVATVLLAAALAAGGFTLQACGQLLFPWMVPAFVVVPGAWLWVMVTRLKRRSLPATPVASDQATLVGTTTAGVARIPDHQLLRAVGKGAYGEVWLARNAVGLYHAVKIIYRREFETESPYEREFRGVTKFMPISRTHPGFVNILHVGRDDAMGCFYCIMEPADDETTGAKIQPDTYVPRNLARHLQKHRRLGAQECLQIGLQLSAALDHLHRAELIHRDIKPANIIFVNGAPKLADIGLVTDVPKEPGAVTYLGTIGYIAPEGPGTPGADIYSLGKVLYEAFTGLDREEFPNLPTSLLGAPDAGFSGLNDIILTACEPDPKGRYRSAADLHADLDALRKKLGGAG